MYVKEDRNIDCVDYFNKIKRTILPRMSVTVGLNMHTCADFRFDCCAW